MRLDEMTTPDKATKLFEAASTKNLHMLHLEQLLFEHGYGGLERIVQYLKNVVEQLEGHANPTTDITVNGMAPQLLCVVLIQLMDNSLLVQNLHLTKHQNL